MKLKYYLIPLLAASVLMSCTKEDEPGIEVPDLSPDATFSLAVESVKTKAATSVDPKDRITKLSVLIYIGDDFYAMKDSVLPTDKLTDPSATVNEVVNIPVKSGNVKILVLANATNSIEFKDKSLTKALEIKTQGLEKEVHSNLTMCSEVMDVTLGVSVHNYLGYNKTDADGIKVISKSPVLLYRNAARIQLSELILAKFTDFGTARKFVLKKVYVANVKSHSYLASKDKTTGDVSNPNWGTVEVPSDYTTAAFWWTGVKDGAAGKFDKLTYANTIEKNSLVYDFTKKASWADFSYYDENTTKQPEFGVTLEDPLTAVYKNVQNNVVFPIGNFFYTYENLNPEEGEKTILILKGDYTYIPKGQSQEETVQDTYYSVVVNGPGVTSSITGVAEHVGIKRNTKYSLLLTIKGPGSPVPDPSERAYIGAKVKVNDWNVIEIDSTVD